MYTINDIHKIVFSTSLCFKCGVSSLPILSVSATNQSVTYESQFVPEMGWVELYKEAWRHTYVAHKS